MQGTVRYSTCLEGSYSLRETGHVLSLSEYEVACVKYQRATKSVRGGRD